MLCREFAERLAERGHRTTVLTSCALNYDTWEDHFEPGHTSINGVEVTRLPIVDPRSITRFSELSTRIANSPSVNAMTERSWRFEQGPALRGFEAELARLAAEADVVAFFTYLYPPTSQGLAAIAGRVPTVLHPTLHDEWPARLAGVRTVVDRCAVIACSTPEEVSYLERRFRPRQHTAVVGIGFENPTPTDDTANEFRTRFDLGNDPYALCLGRVDPNKGIPELLSYYQEYRRCHSNPARLVLCGAQMMPIEDQDGLVITGFVDDGMKDAAIQGAAVLIQPSRQESFGMTLAEALQAEVPVLVNRHCEVTEGLAGRSEGGLNFWSASSFSASLDLLVHAPEVRGALGRNGKKFVEADLTWDQVLSRYEDLIERAISQQSEE